MGLEKAQNRPEPFKTEPGKREAAGRLVHKRKIYQKNNSNQNARGGNPE